MKPIGIFAATRWEIDAVLQAFPSYDVRSVNGISYWVGCAGGSPCWVVRTGIGPRKAENAVRTIMTAAPLSAIISTGFACALNEAGIGDVLIGTDIYCRTSSGYDLVRSCDSELIAEAIHSAKESGVESVSGRFISVAQVVCRSHEKQAIARSSGAIGLDMESVALAMAARDADVPFAVIRTVSDRRDEDLPLDFNLFLRPTGWIAGVVACLSNPSSFAGLSRLRAQSRIAATQLSRFHKRYVNVLSAQVAAGR